MKTLDRVARLAALAGLIAPLLAVAADGAPAWSSDGPRLAQDAVYIELPLEVLAGKLFVEMEVGGTPRRFVFDTGSPSMLSADLAAELKLEVVDRRQGRDAHGAIVETDIAQLDMTLGGVTFHKVPVFVAEFPKTARCLFDGVLGSEMLPLCAWQIDLADAELRCSTDLAELAHIDKASTQKLYDFGYPHTPIMDVRFARKAVSKAMFDTGSSELFSISAADHSGAERNGGVAGTVKGTGSPGGSLGGVAPVGEQRLIELKALSVGEMQLGSVMAPLRALSPSLIGSELLEYFVVTLDSRSSTAYFERYRPEPVARSSFGFGLDFEGPKPRISLVWEDSPAATAGMQIGQVVATINGEAASTSCDGIRRAMRAVSGAESLQLTWEGGAATLEKN
jgi:hypothetical protein